MCADMDNVSNSMINHLSALRRKSDRMYMNEEVEGANDNQGISGKEIG